MEWRVLRIHHNDDGRVLCRILLLAVEKGIFNERDGDGVPYEMRSRTEKSLFHHRFSEKLAATYGRNVFKICSLSLSVDVAAAGRVKRLVDCRAPSAEVSPCPRECSQPSWDRNANVFKFEKLDDLYLINKERSYLHAEHP